MREPGLGHHRVFAGSQKRFDLQVLLDPLEKQLDLPAGLVDAGNRGHRQLEVVGQKDQNLFLLLVVKLDSS